MEESVERGFRAIKIKIGAADLAWDLANVGGVRDVIGPDLRLMGPPMPCSDSTSSKSSGEVGIVPEAVRSGRESGAATQRAVSERMVRSASDMLSPGCERALSFRCGFNR